MSRKEPEKKAVVDLVYSEEEQKGLSGFFGIVESSTFPYVPEAFREFVKDKTKWPVYVLRTPNGLDLTREEDHLGVLAVTHSGKITGFKTNSGELRIWRVQKYLTKAVRHSVNGKIVPFTTTKDEYNETVASKEFMETVSPKLLKELEDAVKKSILLNEKELLGLDY